MKTGRADTKRHTTLRVRAGAWLVVVILFCGWGARLAAQDQPPGEIRPGRHSLWKVQSGTHVVYLVGSVHLLKAANYPLSPAIEKAFSESRRLVLELKLDEVNPQAVQEAMLAKGRLEPGTTLKGIVSPETYGLLQRRAKEIGIPVQALDPFKPWVVALTLTTLKLQKLGYDPQHGIDQYFTRKAKQEGKEISGLETFEFQIDLFDHLSLSEQEALLLETMNELDVMENEFNNLVEAWVQGDTSALEKILLASFREYPEIYQRMVVDRNRGWMGEIGKILMRNEIAIVVVGAGHLVGREGLVELLRAKGYEVEQW